jgi:hypothetical protein
MPAAVRSRQISRQLRRPPGMRRRAGVAGRNQLPPPAGHCCHSAGVAGLCASGTVLATRPAAGRRSGRGGSRRPAGQGSEEPSDPRSTIGDGLRPGSDSQAGERRQSGTAPRRTCRHSSEIRCHRAARVGCQRTSEPRQTGRAPHRRDRHVRRPLRSHRPRRRFRGPWYRCPATADHSTAVPPLRSTARSFVGFQLRGRLRRPRRARAGSSTPGPARRSRSTRPTAPNWSGTSCGTATSCAGMRPSESPGSSTRGLEGRCSPTGSRT